MKDLLHMFHDPEDGESSATEVDISAHSVDSLQHEYHDQIAALLEDGGVNLRCVQIDVRHLGHSRDGRHVFIGMLRLVHWERRSALRLMIGHPLVERLLRRLLRGHWLSDVSHFGGLWLHPSGQMVDGEVMKELRELLQFIETHEQLHPAHPAGPESTSSMWSVPADDSAMAPLTPPPSSSET